MSEKPGTMSTDQLGGNEDQPRPQYVKPTVRAMTESEILSTFQVSVSATTWWVM